MFFTGNTYKALSMVITGCFIALGIYTLGNIYIFDQLYFIFLLITAFYVKKNINLLGIISILILGKALEQITFFALTLNNNAQWVFYFICFLSTLIFQKESGFKYFLAVVVISLYCDLYTHLNESFSPNTVWYVFLALNAFMVRKLIMMRPFTTASYYPDKVEPIPLDHLIHATFGIVIWVNLIICTVLIFFTSANINNTEMLQKFHIYVIHTIMFGLLYIVLKHSMKIIGKGIIKL
ncbi:hypothetical protein [Alteromonas sp. a30]|uniref:hypothetical protein n=1 Tax=Alteromonas sp. a30 TaxID=2730917 RepID=UPI00227FA835|nr:hypothetical protein [Alteromonas sp. a30]MCY7295136.1 hypothetical protein [Alteromonas sp. a30]